MIPHFKSNFISLFFQGNTDRYTVVKNTLDTPTQARFIRFIPTKYYRRKGLRVEVYGSKKVVLNIKEIRLSGGSTPNQGYLEVQYEKGGQWGKVCTKEWTIKESTVACNMLGITGKASPWSMPLIAKLPTVLTSMGSCSGNEKSLANCTLVYAIRRTCSTFLIRGVSCGPPSVILRNAKNMTTATNKTLNKKILRTTASSCPTNKTSTNKTSTKESVNRFLRHLERSVYIHTVTMNRSCQARNVTRQYYVLPVVNLYDINSGRTIHCNVTMDTEDKQTAKCSMEFKTNTVEICSSDENVPLNFCSEPDVLAFDTFKNMHGVSYDLWNKYITSDKNSILKMNGVFTGPPNISSVSPSFTIPGFSGLLNYSVQEKGYVMVTYQGLYFISVSCGNECEIWLRRAEEPGLDDEGTVENLLIKIESPTYPNKYELSRNQYKFLNFSKCHLYHMEAYMRQRVNADYLTVVLRRPGKENNKLFPTEYLYWMRPGFRVLKFNLTNNISRKIDLGSEITLEAVYEFCCKGPKCPSCPIKLKLRLFGQSVMVNRSLEMDCQQHNITYKTVVVVQPGNYSIDITYSYLDDITHWQGQRTIVKSIAVSGFTRHKCFFRRRICRGWSVFPNKYVATGLWTFKGLPGGFVALTSLGVSFLESPTVPWNSHYKNINQCVEFSYLLPTNTTSRLEVFTKNASRKELLWLVSGYHGMKWKRANIPVKSEGDFKVTLRGDSKTKGSLSIAVRDFQVVSRSCSLGPTFAKPGFKCKVTEFKCANGQCINKKQRCNGNHGDCPDDSDEYGCICETGYFSCSDYKCINYTSFCNGIRDCQDGEDEHHCEQKCLEYQCLDGACKSCSQETSCKDDTHHHYCDAISIKQMPIVTKFCELQEGTCGFDNQLCSLQSDTNASLHWKFFKPVDTNNKFPDHDHTSMTNRGSYVLLKSNGKMKTGYGRLVKRWNINYTVCMQFWYFITEQSDSSIEISIGTATNTSLLWKTNNSTSSDWAFGQVEIPAGNSPGKVIISGCVSKHFVALDDLGFIEGGCASINSQQNPSCYFNKNEERGWDIANTWTLNKESVDSYLSLSKSLNVTSVVSSPLIHPRSEGWRCLRFWFYSGKIYFRRRLAVKFETENKTTEEWSYRSETNKWTFIQLPILEKERLKIKIHGIKYQNAILAIDNITFLKEDCKRIPAHQECQEYKSLSFSDRRKDAIASDQLFRVCDDHLSMNTWYRFIASAGNQLASSCIAKQSSCSTENMGWVKGSLPSVEDGIVERQLCFASENQCCNRETTIKIRNCKEYVVYQFPKKLLTCPSRYCGVYSGNECQDTPLGVANRSIIEDNRFTASYFNNYYAPHTARLHGTDGWMTIVRSNPNEYLQIDLGALFIICAVATQGHSWRHIWTTEYKISTSIDNTTWTTYQSGGKPKVI